MKHLLIIGLLTSTIFAMQAQVQGEWYVSGSVGGYFRETETGPELITNKVSTTPGTVSASFDPGVTANLDIGHPLPFRLRVEAEMGYTDYAPDKTIPRAARSLRSTAAPSIGNRATTLGGTLAR